MKKGYSLVEILIGMAILGIIITITFPSFFSYNKKRNLELSAQEIKTDLETAAGLAFAPQDATHLGYGLHFDFDGNDWTYFLYVDKTSRATLSDNDYNPSGDDTLPTQATRLRSGVDVESTQVLSQVAPGPPVNYPSGIAASFYVYWSTPFNDADDPDFPDDNPGLPYNRIVGWNGDYFSPITGGKEGGKIVLTNGSDTRTVIVNMVTGSINIE